MIAIRNTRHAVRLALFGAVLAAGCVEPPAITPPTSTTPPTPESTLPTAPIAIDGHPDIAPPIEVEEPLPGARARKRMDLDQLNAALRAATGGIGWVENNNDQLVALAATLGRPDFLSTTEEDRSPSPLFQKFLGDASRKVCADLLVAEGARAPEDRTFFVGFARTDGSDALDAARADGGPGLDGALSQLLLRFHGRRTDTAATRGALDGWRFLFQSTERGADPQTAWSAVCIALIQHPDFYTY